jgi:hypothetical protein
MLVCVRITRTEKHLPSVKHHKAQSRARYVSLSFSLISCPQHPVTLDTGNMVVEAYDGDDDGAGNRLC